MNTSAYQICGGEKSGCCRGNLKSNERWLVAKKDTVNGVPLTVPPETSLCVAGGGDSTTSVPGEVIVGSDSCLVSFCSTVLILGSWQPEIDTTATHGATAIRRAINTRRIVNSL